MMMKEEGRQSRFKRRPHATESGSTLNPDVNDDGDATPTPTLHRQDQTGTRTLPRPLHLTSHVSDSVMILENPTTVTA
jgi:hypothetical protein